MTKNKQSDSQTKATNPSDSNSATETTTASEPVASAPKKQPAAKTDKTAKILAIIAIILSISIAIGLYWHGQQFREHADTQLQLLKTSLQAKEQNLLSAQTNNKNQLTNIEQQVSGQNQTMAALKAQLELTEQNRKTIERQLALLNIKDANHWRLNEASYLLQLAANKLWLEQDPATAIALLLEADNSINNADDPHLLPLRRAINNDVQLLKGVPLVDKEGIAFRLESILQQAESLQLAEIELPEVVEQQDNDLSADSADWQDNLSKSWRKFSENFITVRRRDGQVEALIEPQHAWYLKENLKLQLQQAEQALFRSQGELFKAKLQRAEQWVSEFFIQNTQAQAMVEDLKQLQQLDIVDKLPEQLSSLGAAEQAIKERQQRLIPSLEGAE
ncbi:MULTISPECIES: uroporphyrinogen-III C-methyltransferase [unclassified Agarivorans]|uniref:uroporphyrinogen-III C-methyltransferase n=1 Tax=unclassified Agarivorans TaxID=2636026 RepID=UPI0026E417A1|nr:MULTISPECIES: uroporphyrinogen-III C-methyltransferase [unclassified Agarivorans]MDO6685662.1 uroporphyrinogen-III C-methyltransferase [Agarivorans sp. 3_MG-2023]MDO6716223.1 uroporphyrinogen-III C-methyltransferase [Agarivorans sp. 2_MG-2023]